jgi:hypothetical protein
MIAGAKPPYRPPEIALDAQIMVPLASLSAADAELHVGETVTGVGGFVDLNTVENAAAATMLHGNAGDILTPRNKQSGQPAEDRAKEAIRLGVGSYLRPKNFGGTIVGGEVLLLPYDKGRTDSYLPAERHRPIPHTAVTLYIMGSLGSREAVSSPFTQEFTLYMTVGGLIRRYVGPRDLLKAAAAEIAEVRKAAIRAGNVGPGADLGARGRPVPGRTQTSPIKDIDGEA